MATNTHGTQRTHNAVHELPMLAGIAGLLRWCEELLNLLSGPLLTAGMLISLIDLLTDGKLLLAYPALLFGWAISQGIGIEANLVSAWDKAHLAWRERRWGTFAALAMLGLALAYVGYLSAAVFAVQQADGLTVVQALRSLGMNDTTWLVERNVLAVALVCLSGWTRYHAPSRAEATADERERLLRELELEPLRQQVRARKLAGIRSAVAGLGINPDRPPTDGGTPAETPVPEPVPDSQPLPMPATPRTISTAPARVMRPAASVSTAEQRIRALLTADPTMPFLELVRRARVSESTASKWATVIAAERARNQRRAR